MNGNGSQLDVRCAVVLEPEVISELEDCISTLLGRRVTLVQKLDGMVSGAVIVLDARRQIRIDPRAPADELKLALEREVLGGLDVDSQARSATSFIKRLDKVSFARVVETNLRAALGDLASGDVLLRCRSGIDSSVMESLRMKLCDAAGRDVRLQVDVDPHMDEGAELLLADDKRIILDARYQWLEEVEREVALARIGESTLDLEESHALIRRMIEDTEPELKVERLSDTGVICEVGDGVALVSGLRDVGSQELVELENGAYAIALSLNSEKVGCVLLEPDENVRPGSRVVRTGHLLKVPVGDDVLGRVVDPLGRPMDGRGPTGATQHRVAEAVAVGVVDRLPVDVPLHTGVKVVDALVPLGRGQRELIIGDRKTGKTTLAVDTILNQKSTGVVCVYCAIGQKASTVAGVARVLDEEGALGHTVVVASLPGEPPAFRYLAPYTACAMAEHFMFSGRDALIVYDDLSKHAVTYREISALLNRPIGREAYPGDVFYLHSRLLERAARLTPELGGGSLTALPIVETQAGDVSAFIPTNVISICDGQIFLDTELFNEGFRPALNVGLSVSRVGGSAQTPAMKSVAGGLRIDLAQYTEMAQFIKFGAEVDAATLRQLDRGRLSRELLKQPAHSCFTPGLAIAVLFAVSNGLFDGIAPSAVADHEEGFCEYLKQRHRDLLAELDAGGSLSPQIRDTLGRAAALYGESRATAVAEAGDA